MNRKLGNDNAWPLPRPRPAELERVLRQLADRVGDQGDKAMRYAAEFAVRGYPASTNGSDGGRSSDPTSSTERAALDPGLMDGIDYRMQSQMSNLMVSAVLLHASFDLVLAHASDDDPVPAGTGPCLVEGCGHVCNPRKNPNDRLRGGLCPKHHKRLMRMDPRPDRDWYIRYAETEDVA